MRRNKKKRITRKSMTSLKVGVAPSMSHVTTVNSNVVNEVHKEVNIMGVGVVIEVVNMVKRLGAAQLILLCRRGNDSQVAATELKEVMAKEGVRVRDVAGGLHAWARDVDKDFPVY